MLIHDAVLEFLICGNTRVIASSFNTAMERLNKRDKQTRKSGYETQFEVSSYGIIITDQSFSIIQTCAIILGTRSGFTQA